MLLLLLLVVAVFDFFFVYFFHFISHNMSQCFKQHTSTIRMHRVQRSIRRIQKTNTRDRKKKYPLRMKFSSHHVNSSYYSTCYFVCECMAACLCVASIGQVLQCIIVAIVVLVLVVPVSVSDIIIVTVVRMSNRVYP